MEVMATQAGLPSVLPRQRQVIDIERVVFERQIIVASNAIGYFGCDTFGSMLDMAGQTTPRIDFRHSRDEPGFVEAMDRVTFVGPRVAVKALLRRGSCRPKIDGRLPRSG